MACSALKRKYRQFLRKSLGANVVVYFILLDPPYDVLVKRVTSRDHFMPPSLLQSQLKTLEPGDDISLCVTAGVCRCLTPYGNIVANAQKTQELGHPAFSEGAVTQGSSFVGDASFAFAAVGSTGVGEEDLKVARGLLQLPGCNTAMDTAMFCGNYPDAHAVAAEVRLWLERHRSPD
ncbi:hypothetical protein DUNSADRAFT_16879 [Dunaliella salina]|uniref:gluconokinase n=1 Tax=Dunaliella salina TaxID=3046 RepID=A0ABQ7H969_DUNSA|nr:hypothetical protein DUNSADRAFT_16879 [Dunaliella salina]|eukprot:KAF5843380.1 hypothetical protein DUNSADRAFT_16879 [Dunaliella salina]